MACLPYMPATLQRVFIWSFGHQTFLLRKKQRPQSQPCSTIYVVFPLGWNCGEVQRIKLVVQVQSQPDNFASIPLLTATFVQLVHPVARGPQRDFGAAGKPLSVALFIRQESR